MLKIISFGECSILIFNFINSSPIDSINNTTLITKELAKKINFLTNTQNDSYQLQYIFV